MSYKPGLVHRTNDYLLTSRRITCIQWIVTPSPPHLALPQAHVYWIPRTSARLLLISQGSQSNAVTALTGICSNFKSRGVDARTCEFHTCDAWLCTKGKQTVSYRNWFSLLCSAWLSDSTLKKNILKKLNVIYRALPNQQPWSYKTDLSPFTHTRTRSLTIHDTASIC